MDDFIQWFQSHGAYLDTSIMGIAEFPPSEGGRGAVALRDIPIEHTVFSIPRSLTLSTRTSQLPAKFGHHAWRKAKLHSGWAGLILCMMWEQANGPTSKWAEYLDTLPKRFDTPMFWAENDLSELKGTSVVEKLGKAEAELDYHDKLLPAVKSRPDLFRPEDIQINYSLEAYHIMGSRILSRSFVVATWEGEDGEDNAAKEAAGTSTDNVIDVDGSDEGQLNEGNAEGEDSDDEEEDDSSEIAMVPMADILNARYQTENAKLFYERDDLKMVSTKPIKAGEQIWNTYGDLPNAELLRRYGHVDVLPLASGRIGNPGDVVEIKASLIVSAVSRYPEAARDAEATERIDWWLEEGGEDVFVLDRDYELPPAMLSFARLLLLARDEWQKVREKSKPPKPKLEGIVYDIVLSALHSRLTEYPTTLEADGASLNDSLALNRRHALIVRIGEKDILRGTLEKVEGLKVADDKQRALASNKRRGDASDSTVKTKKSKR